MSISNAQDSAAKTRPYRLGRRAERQQETRRRIVEAAVDLHGTLGPARTSVAQIAQRAGVQRHTYYAHFPDERSLMLACSALAMDRDPLPGVDEWRRLPPGRERIVHGLAQLYAWYARNEGVTACVLRDAEVHELTREIAQLRMGPTFERAALVLGESLNARSRAMLDVALQFACWRALSRSHEAHGAAELMADALAGLSG